AVPGPRHDDPAVLVLRARLALQTSAGDRRLVAEHLAHQAIAACRDGGATACEALDLAARCARSRSLDDASGLLERALDIAERENLAAWRLRILNELGTVEMLRQADGARLQRALTAARAAGAERPEELRAALRRARERVAEADALAASLGAERRET
ncbi:MAG: hypothetical protein M3273_02895, partial [Actinomycetota bacterium]|nr:hypothetical protein [Actinomycetota bacterium]